MLPPETKWSESSVELRGVIPTVFQRCTVETKLSALLRGELCTPQASAEPFRKARRNAACLFCSCHSSRKRKTLIYFINKCIAVRKSPNLLSLFLSQTTLDLDCCWSKQTEYPHLTADLSPKTLLGPSHLVVETFSRFFIEGSKSPCSSYSFREHPGILVFKLKRDIGQVAPQRSTAGRVGRSVVSLFPNCTGEKVCASWMTTLLVWVG